MRRRLQNLLDEDFGKKVQLINGPRQVGKTTLSQQIAPDFQYLDYGRAEHQPLFVWDHKRSTIVFDDLYKMPQWKQWLKGIERTEKSGPSLIVTGSARLENDPSYFQYSLNPLTLNELSQVEEGFDARKSFIRLMNCSGFPEPYLNGSSDYYQRWKSTHLDSILRQDLVDLKTVSSIQGIEQLIYLLAQNVGSIISYSSLSRRLQVSDKTVKRWLGILESLFVVFRVTPYAPKKSQVISKAPKFYFYDVARVEGSDEDRFENLVALALQSELEFIKDAQGKNLSLHFLRRKDGREIDFLIADRTNIRALIECTWSDGAKSPNFRLADDIAAHDATRIQLVAELDQEKTFADGCEIRFAPEWLSQLNGQQWIKPGGHPGL